MWLKRILSFTLLALGVLTLAGCAGSSTPASGEQPGRADELRELAMILPLYSGQNRRGPSKVADLASYENAAPLGFRALQAGEIIVVWGATMPGEGDGGGTTAIVAYEKKAPTEGGYVLLHNGTVKQMSAAEFSSAPKAGK